MRKECPIRKRQSTISSRRLSRQDHTEYPNACCTACNLLSDCSDQKSDHSFLTYCFMIGRKSVNGSGMLIFRPFRAVLGALSGSSLPRIPTWLSTQQNTTSFRRVFKMECSSKILRTGQRIHAYNKFVPSRANTMMECEVNSCCVYGGHVRQTFHHALPTTNDSASYSIAFSFEPSV